MSYSHLTARDVPDTRTNLITWATGNGRRVLAGIGHEEFAPVLAASARAAELFYVNADMTALARHIGQGLDVFGMSADDLPAQHGLLIWEEAASSEEPGVAPTAVLWAASARRFVVSLLAPAEAHRAWCGRQAEAAAAIDSAASITAGKLVYRGRGPTLQVDEPDRTWDSLDLAEHEEATRTLLATLILIRQPVDERRSLHQIESIPAYRAAARRAARAGADPTQPVRYITLRQTLRPSTDEGSTDHAGRIYRHRWFVKAHRVRQFYPTTGDHKPIWRGPYLVAPRGCEDAPILGGDRVNVLRR